MSTRASNDLFARRISATAVALFAAYSSANLASAQSFSGLGQPPGASSSAARAISADGTVVVGDGGPAFAGVGFRWTAASGMQDLGTLPGGSYSFAPGISDDGAVATGYGDSSLGQRAYRWTSATGMVDIGGLPGATQVLGSDANKDGSVLVGTVNTTSGYRAFRWTSAGMTSLGTLSGGALSFGYGTNSDGSVVVGDSYSPIGDVAFRWTSAGGMQSLGALSGGTFSFAYAVSADGQVVVGDSDSTNGDVAYRWTNATGMVSLGTLPVPFAYMVSNGVSADGSVIVGSSVGATNVAFLWKSSLGIVDLNAYLPSLGIDLTGWTLTDVGGVSADGQTIAGTGTHNGVDEAWIATLSNNVGVAFCLGDGSGVACPCGNNGATGNGCANSSFASGAHLVANGVASVSSDTVVLHASNLTGSIAVFFQGGSQAPAKIFGDGIDCIGSPIVRLGNKAASGTSSYPQLGDLPISIRGGISAIGGTFYYQCYYRNPLAAFCPPATFNVTNGVQITWTP